MANIPKNALLYWNADTPDASVLAVKATWERICPNWSVTLHSRSSAHAFLNTHYGTAIAALFMSCKLPAMQSDFFRVFWALQLGGVYMDLTFQPKAEPLFHHVGCNLTVPLWVKGRIVNGIFAAEKDSAELKKVGMIILKNVSLQKTGGIWGVAGPGVWIETLGNEERPGYGLTNRTLLFRDFIEFSGYASSTRGTDQHWSVLQKQGSYYE